MWELTENKWEKVNGNIDKSQYNAIRQDLEDIRFYSKCLKGISYNMIDNPLDLYSVLNVKKDWTFANTLPNSISGMDFTHEINSNTINNEWKKFNTEWGMTLKTNFTPEKVIRDGLKNFIQVDLATTEMINILDTRNIKIDGKIIRNGQKVLVKDQINLEVLSNTIDPNTHFISNFYPTQDGTQPNTEYFFYNEENGVYIVENNSLVKMELDYTDIVQKSIYVKGGDENRDKQYKLSRLLNGFFPEDGQPKEFLEKDNILIRNEFQYQDIFEINIYDSVEDTNNNRNIFIGDFGAIFIWDNNSEKLNIIRNKFKFKLFSIKNIENHYIIVGERGSILRVDKTTLEIEYIQKSLFPFYEVSFFNNKRGFIVGYEKILFTQNGGKNWEELNLTNTNDRLKSVNFYAKDRCIIAGENGVIFELKWINNKWIKEDLIFEKKIGNEIFENVFDYNKVYYDESKGHFIVGNEMIFIDNNDDYYFIENDFNIKDIEIDGNIIFIVTDSGFFILDYNDILTEIGNLTDENTIEISFININNNNYLSINKIIGSFMLTSENFTIENFETPLNFTDLTQNFETTSRLLFLDYDIGSKLNFYKDDTYRLPEQESFTASFITTLSSGISEIEVRSKVDEKSWIDYYKDILKEKYDGDFIEFNHKFSVVNNDKTLITGNDIGGIDNLFGTMSSTFSSPYIMHLGHYDNENWIVIKNDNIDIEPSDVINIESDILTGRFICVKNETINSEVFSYFKSRFDSQLEEDFFGLTASQIEIENLNKFPNNNVTGLDNLHEKMNKHYIGDGYNFEFIEKNLYGLPINSHDVEIGVTPLYNNKTAYYNLELEIIDNSRFNNDAFLEYEHNFLNFGYTPRYNILDFLNNINDNIFIEDYEFLALPQFENLDAAMYPILDETRPVLIGPLKDVGSAQFSKNIISFHVDYKDYWESLFLYTFINVEFDSSIFEKNLIIEKGFDESSNRYFIKLNKEINAPNSTQGDISILSRRKLEEISSDLNELNNIQTNFDVDRETFRKKLNFKFFTDSYARILLSDKNIKDNLSAIVYTDNNNELSSNIINIEEKLEFETTIVDNSGLAKLVFNTNIEDIHINDYLIINDPNSPEIYSGYHVINNIDYDENEITLETPFISSVDVDVTYYNFDRNLFFLPTDLIDVGIDAKSKIAVDIKPEMVKVTDKFELVDIDKSKFRFNLIEGLTLDRIVSEFPWLLEAELTDATIGIDDEGPIFYKGIWECGRFFKGKFMSGTWLSGQFYSGTMNSYDVNVNKISATVDFNIKGDGTRWYDGDFRGGTMNWVKFFGGTFIDGVSNNIEFFDGTHQRGEWNGGHFKGGLWINGIWNSGIFEATERDSIWLDGTWNGGDFRNGYWWNGKFSNRKGQSRFGVMPINSRKAIWNGGHFISGEFHSILNLNQNSETIPSINHKFSEFRTGKISNIDFWGGQIMSADFNKGNFIDGICKGIKDSIEDINQNSNIVILNKRWHFNRNDKLWVINSNNQWEEHMVNDVIYDNILDETQVILYNDISILNPNDIVTRFKEANWINGVMLNGIFLNNNFRGGMWLDGYFGESALWG